MKKETINWGIISCAAIAEGQFIPGLLQSSTAKLYAISSRGNNDKLKRFAKKFSPVKSYESYEELLEDPEIDAIYNPLPNGLHKEWTIKAMQKGKHVLCEKPMGLSAAEVEEMYKVSQDNKVLLMEAFAYRHSPLTHKLKELINAGRIGELRYIEAHFSFLLENLNDVRLIKALGGGATYDIGCYNISLIRFLAGEEPISILAQGLVGTDSKVDEESSVLMTFPSGLTAVSYCSFKCDEHCGYRLLGSKGSIYVPVKYNHSGTAQIELESNGRKEILAVNCPHNYQLEAEQFAAAILKGEKLEISYAESLGNAKVIDSVLDQIMN